MISRKASIFKCKCHSRHVQQRVIDLIFVYAKPRKEAVDYIVDQIDPDVI